MPFTEQNTLKIYYYSVILSRLPVNMHIYGILQHVA